MIRLWRQEMAQEKISASALDTLYFDPIENFEKALWLVQQAQNSPYNELIKRVENSFPDQKQELKALVFSLAEEVLSYLFMNIELSDEDLVKIDNWGRE